MEKGLLVIFDKLSDTVNTSQWESVCYFPVNEGTIESKWFLDCIKSLFKTQYTDLYVSLEDLYLKMEIFQSLRRIPELSHISIVEFCAGEWVHIPNILVLHDNQNNRRTKPPGTWGYTEYWDQQEGIMRDFSFFFVRKEEEEMPPIISAKTILRNRFDLINKYRNVFIDLDPAVTFALEVEILHNPLLSGVNFWFPVFITGSNNPIGWKKVCYENHSG